MRLRPTSDMFANIAVVAASVVVISSSVPRLSQAWRAESKRSFPYEQGDAVDWLRSVDFKAPRQSTLVMFINSTCRFCTDSMGFYARLSALPERKVGSVRLVAASFESVDRTSAYLRGYGIDVDQIVSLTTGDTKLRATPCVLLIDRSGRISRIWNGLQSPDGEADILAALNRKS